MRCFFRVRHPFFQVLFCASVASALFISPGHALAGGLFLSEITTPDSLGTAGVANVTNNRNASAVVTNPAGLSGIEDSEWILGAQLLYLDSKIHIDQPASDRQKAGSLSGVPAVFYAHRVSPKVVLGASLHSAGGLGLDFGSNWAGRYFLDEVNFGYLNLTGSAAYEVNDKLSFGVSVIGQYMFLNAITRVNTLIPPDGKIDYDSDSIAPGFTLGMMIQPTDSLRVGFHYTSKIKHDLDGDLKVTDVGGKLPFPPVPVIPGTRSLDIEIDTPQTFTLGVDYRANDRLNLMTYFSYQEWGEFGEVKIKPGNASDIRADSGYNNTSEYGIAARYQFAGWTGYTGLTYIKEMVNKSNRTISLPGDDTYKFGLGAEFPLDGGKVLGLGYTYVRLGKGRLTQQNALGTSTLSGEFTTNDLHVLGVSIRF